MAIPFETLTEVFSERTSGSLRERTYLRHKPERGKPYVDITFGEFGDRTKGLYAALSKLGARRGDRIAMLSESRPEWLMADYASLAMGAITVPMFPTLTASQAEYIVRDSGSKILIVSNDLQLGKSLKLIESCPDLETVIILNDTTRHELPSGRVCFLHYRELSSLPGVASDFETEAKQAKPDDTITIIYTSGTTGTPKGVMLTHSNLLSNIQGATDALPPISDQDVALSFLPLSHAFERVAMYLFFLTGFTVAFAESIDTVAENLIEIQPTVMTAVPRFYERIYGRLMRMREKMPPAKRRIFDWGLAVGKANGVSWEGQSVSPIAKLERPIADALVLRKIRERTGGKIRFFVSGAAALPAEIGRAFAGFGLPIIEGYGMTEASPIITVNPYSKMRWGTVGKPIPNIEVNIASDGEILTRGAHVMKGYYKHPEATSQVIDTDGWLHTGDIGEIDPDGYVKITDRKKHLFVSSGGKNIAPAHIEATLEQSKYIDQILLVGDKRQFCTALIVPDFELFREIARQRAEPVLSNEELAKNVDVRRVLDLEIDRLQKDLATFERVRRFIILPEAFTIENGMMTPTLKVKRKEVERHYKELIDSLYLARE